MVQDLQDPLHGSATGTRKERFKERVEEKAVVMKHFEADGDKKFGGQERGAVSGPWRVNQQALFVPGCQFRDTGMRDG